MSEINRSSKLTQEDILEHAIQRVMAGESLDTILASHGSDASWLGPMLVVVADVRDLRDTVPVPQPEASLAQFLAAAERIRPNPLQGRATHSWWQRLIESLRFPALGVPRLALTAVRAALVVVALTVGSAFFLGANTIATAQHGLPGAPLYPIKRLGEEIYLRLPQSSESRGARVGEYEERRRDEVRILLERQLEARVAFQGVVEAFDSSRIVVSGVSAQITDKTQVDGPLTIGARVLVRARTAQDSALVAERILVENAGQPHALPSPTATATATPGTTPSSVVTPIDASTPALEPTKTPGLPLPEEIHESDASPTPTSVPAEQSPESPEEDHDIDEGVEEDQRGDHQPANDDDTDNSNDAGGGNNNEAGDDVDNSNDNGDSNDDAENSNDNGDSNDDAENSNESGGSDNENSDDSDNRDETDDNETGDGNDNAANSDDAGGNNNENSDDSNNRDDTSDNESVDGNDNDEAQTNNDPGDGANHDDGGGQDSSDSDSDDSNDNTVRASDDHSGSGDSSDDDVMDNSD